MSDTPRTDAVLDELAEDQRGQVHYNGITFINFARQLEREVGELSELKRVTLERYLTNAQKAIEAERDQLRQQLEELNKWKEFEIKNPAGLSSLHEFACRERDQLRQQLIASQMREGKLLEALKAQEDATRAITLSDPDSASICELADRLRENALSASTDDSLLREVREALFESEFALRFDARRDLHKKVYNALQILGGKDKE